MMLDKGAKIVQWGKNSPTSGDEKIEYPHKKKNEVDSYLSHIKN